MLLVYYICIMFAIAITFTFHHLTLWLCYIFYLICLGKVSDILTMSGHAIPEAWNVYHMIHLVNSGGVTLTVETQADVIKQASKLLLGWLLLYKIMPKVFSFISFCLS